jgi:hypothetical protein
MKAICRIGILCSTATSVVIGSITSNRLIQNAQIKNSLIITLAGGVAVNALQQWNRIVKIKEN